MEEASNDSDTQELDEPTLPFTRKQIELQLREAGDEGTPEAAAAEAAEATSSESIHEVDDKDGFELAGRRIRVSLDELAHIGGMGSPANMITSKKSASVAGAFGVYNAYKAPERQRLGWWLAGAVALLPVLLLLMAILGLLTGDKSEPPPPPTRPIEATVADAVSVSVPPSSTIAAPTPPIGPAVTPKPKSLPPSKPPVRTKSKGEAATSVCAAQRRDVKSALSRADWGEAELLTRNCWRKSRKTKVLRMRALFELSRFEECIKVGEGDRSKEVSKWKENCSRSLRLR